MALDCRVPDVTPARRGGSWRAACAASLLLLGFADVLGAQGVEVVPFAGYRFGGDLYELATARPVDRDGAPAVGFVVNVPLGAGLQFEGFATHQSAAVDVAITPAGRVGRSRVVVQHFQGGGLQEFGDGRVRPFLTGMLGLSRYAAAGDTEVRFTLGTGAGVKLFPASTFGLRLDARAFATFVNMDGEIRYCSSGGCILNLDTLVVWQAEFSVGLVIRLR